MKNTEEMLSLLLSIKHAADFSPYLIRQMGFGGIGNLCLEAVSKGYIIDEHDKYKITHDGLLYIEQTNNKLGRKGIEKKIAKMPDAIIAKLPLDSIYLPDKF